MNILPIDSSILGANSIIRPLMSSQFATPTWVRRVAASLSAATLLATTPAHAELKPWPAAFRAEQMSVSDGTQYVRIGGAGPAVVLLHGFGDTGDMWVPLAEVLMKDHTVIVPDLRGMGLSSHPEGGYQKVAQARDLAGILDRLGIKEIALVTHDIGNMVGYAFAAQYAARTTKWVAMDAPLPFMVSIVPHLTTNCTIRRLRISVPMIEPLLDGVRYLRPDSSDRQKTSCRMNLSNKMTRLIRAPDFVSARS